MAALPRKLPKCAATLRQMIYVPGELYSVNPFLAQHIPNLFARNERRNLRV